MPGRLVIFDNDGVLVDSERLANGVLADLLTAHGVATTLEESIERYMGGTIVRVRELVAEDAGVVLPEDFDERYHRCLFESFERELAAVDGVVDLLDRLDAAGRRWCVASSGTHERIATAHRITGLARRSAGRVFSAEEVARGKPAPDLFELAAASNAVAPSECVVVEDSPLGVAAARAAGMAVIGFAALTPPERLVDADHVCTTMAEVAAVLGLDR